MNKYIIYELEQLEKITGYSLQHIKNDINDVYSKLEEKDKEIDRLNKELETYKKDFEEANNLALDLINDKQKYVNNSIKDIINILNDKISKLNKIIKQKDNIINELEKDIKDELKRYNRQKYLKNPAKSKLAEFKEEAFDYMLYKLKELKGSDK